MKKSDLTEKKIFELIEISNEIEKRNKKKTNFITYYWNIHRLNICMEQWKWATGCKYPNMLIDDKIMKDLNIVLKNFKRDEEAKRKKERVLLGKKEVVTEKPYKRQSLEEIVAREEDNARLIKEVLFDENYVSDTPDPKRKRG